MDQQADESALLAAIDSLRRSVDASPDNPVLMVSLAQLLLSASDAGAAIGLATPVLSLQPDSPAGAEVLAAATAILTSTARASDATPSDDDREHAKLTTAPHPLSAADAIDDMLEELREQERRHSVLLSHVAGLFEQRLETSFLGPIRNPAPMDYYGAARRCAAAGELRARFLSVGLHEVLAHLFLRPSHPRAGTRTRSAPACERWWDGRAWTNQVRTLPELPPGAAR